MKSFNWALILLFCSSCLKAELGEDANGWLIIVNETTGIHSLEKKQVMSLFLGRARFLPSGQKVIAYDYPDNSKERAEFYKTLTGKNIAEIDAYWARLKYSGRASPPDTLRDLQTIIEQVEKEPGGIAYIPAKEQQSIADRNINSVLILCAK